MSMAYYLLITEFGFSILALNEEVFPWRKGFGWNGQVNMRYSLVTSLTTQHSHFPTRDNHLNRVKGQMSIYFFFLFSL